MKARSLGYILDLRNLCRAYEVDPYSPLNARLALSQAQLLLSVKYASGTYLQTVRIAAMAR